MLVQVMATNTNYQYTFLPDFVAIKELFSPPEAKLDLYFGTKHQHLMTTIHTCMEQCQPLGASRYMH